MHNIVVIVGNGFNSMLKEFIKIEYDSKIDLFNKFTEDEIDDLCSEINDITGLWERFDDFFEELIEEYRYTSEELIKMIHLVLEFLTNIDMISKLVPDMDDNIEKFKEGLNSCIARRIFEISEEFRSFELNDGYSRIAQIFPEFGKEVMAILKENNIKKSYFVTTNYDGILDTLLCAGGNFLFADGFGNDQNSNKVYREYNFKKDHLRVHLHGSYRFFYNGFQVNKLSKGTKNENPVMIFNQPRYKKKQIMNYDILREYYRELENRLNDSNKVIIIGNSLRCEPHIKKLILTKFNKKENEIVIFDQNPQRVENELLNRKHNFKTNIIPIYTDDISDIYQFLDIFSSVIQG